MDISADKLKPFLHDLCLSSGRIIMEHYRSRSLAVDRKSDDSPVTIADRDAEEYLRERISREFPDHGILGEEFGETNPDAEFCWVLDPIDGTISFTEGCPLFGTLIGLTKGGKPWLGAVHHPAMDLLLIGDGTETMLNGELTRVRDVPGLNSATLLASDVCYMERPDFASLARQCRVVRSWGDCFGYAQVASGFADIMVDPVLNSWDLLPLVPVVQGAGGIVTQWDGQQVTRQSTSAVAATPALHSQVIHALNSVGGGE